MAESLMNNKSFDNKRIAEGYAKRPWIHKRIITELKSDIGSEFKNGLDVGCGAGLSTKALHMICQKVTGTDISSDMINICKDIYDSDAAYSFYVAKAEETHVPECKFERYDIVTAAGVINWVDRETFLKNVQEVMTENGKLIIYDFWITDKMQNNALYTEWHNEEYLHKFPKPSRREEGWKQKDLPSLMHIEKQKEFDVTYTFKLDEFVDFMMIQSNVNVKIENGEISESDARFWFQSSLERIFEDNRCTLLFHGYYWIIKKV